MNDTIRPRSYQRTTCRLCSQSSLERVLSLPETPPANEFVSEPGTPQAHYPLDLMLCWACGHLQLGVVVDPELLFRNYVYVSGTSPVFRAHFDKYALDCVQRFGLMGDDFVVDIGSNDATFLKRLIEHTPCRVLGIEPATEIARLSALDGIGTVNAFFNEDVAKSIVARHGQAKLIVANNVMAHIDDLQSVMLGVRQLLSHDGVFVFEVQYALDLYRNTLFDTIYHEHLCYLTVGPLAKFIEQCGLTLFDVQHVDTHGGSIRCFAAFPNKQNVSERVAECIREERAASIAQPKAWWHFGVRLAEVDQQLEKVLMGTAGTIAGYGAPAKATTLMHRFDIDGGVLRYIVDDSTFKQGLYSPGKHVRVVPSAQLVEEPPDAVLVLAWNFSKPIVAKLHGMGVMAPIIIPLPDVCVVGAVR